MGPLTPSIRAFTGPKQGESAASNRDAWHSNRRADGQTSPVCLRVAIADGASTASGSGLWARMLVQASTDGIAPWSRPGYRSRVLGTLRERWRQLAAAALPPDAPWFAAAALDRGAFATLLRLDVRGNAWRAEAWGDSCLFHLRDGRLIEALPCRAPADFEQDPFLLASLPGHDHGLSQRLVQHQGSLRRGDTLLLASDALACWLLATGAWSEALERLETLPDPAGCQAWIEDLRQRRGLKDDDCTLVRVSFR
jgi:hypothetical protein